MARFLANFFAVQDHDLNSFFMQRCLEGVKIIKTHDTFFFSLLVQTWVRSTGFNSSEILLFISHFQQVGIQAQKFENTRIGFNSDVFATLVNYQYF